MQFIDLQKQYQYLKPQIDKAIQKVLDHSHYIMGEEVKLLERQLADYVGVKHCNTCGNGTEALVLAMMAYDIKKGDAVFVPTFTFYASAETISVLGATPVFVDVDERTFNISPVDLESAIVETLQEGKWNPRAIVAVDLFGLPADFEKIHTIAKKYNLLVVEDGAQGFGGAINEKRACSFGDISTTSFFPAKPLGCYGDGGAIFTNEDNVRDYIESVKVHGKGADKYDNVRIGMNSRLDTMQAAILQVKLKALQDFELEQRKNIADKYREYLSDIVKTPFIPRGYFSSYAQYSVLFESEEERNRAEEHLKAQGIPSMIYYKKSMHQQTVYRKNPSIYRNFSNAESVSKRILNLPMHPHLKEEEIQKIENALRAK